MTNQVNQIDNTIASRIHLLLKYESLGLDSRKGTWESFPKKAVTKKGEACYSREHLFFLTKKISMIARQAFGQIIYTAD